MKKPKLYNISESTVSTRPMTPKDLEKIKPDPIPPLPSRTQILTCYNKYRKGYYYLDDVIELRSIVLPIARAFLNNTKKLNLLWQESCKDKDNQYLIEDFFDKFCDKSDGLLSGQNGHWMRYLRERIEKLEKAQTDIDILVGIDAIFHYAHDQGPILIHMVKGQGRNDLDRLEKFLETLDKLRDW